MAPQSRAPESAAIPRVGGAPLTLQVLDAVLEAIRRGSFPNGRLPPEDQLAEMLGVSRTTVRRALQSLEQIGLIERRPGRGTRLRLHARPDLLALHGLVPFPTLLRELGHEVASNVSWRRVDEPNPELSALLEREVTGSYEISVVLLADGVPAVSMSERFPVDVAREPSDMDMQAGSILFVSERCFIKKIDHAVATLEPRVVQPDDSDNVLGMPAGVPYLALHEIFYSADEVALAVSEVGVNPDYVTFSVFRRFL